MSRQHRGRMMLLHMQSSPIQKGRAYKGRPQIEVMATTRLEVGLGRHCCGQELGGRTPPICKCNCHYKQAAGSAATMQHDHRRCTESIMGGPTHNEPFRAQDWLVQELRPRPRKSVDSKAVRCDGPASGVSHILLVRSPSCLPAMRRSSP
jgi:hypothetical protein